jgi:hypothetical protein
LRPMVFENRSLRRFASVPTLCTDAASIERRARRLLGLGCHTWRALPCALQRVNPKLDGEQLEETTNPIKIRPPAFGYVLFKNSLELGSKKLPVRLGLAIRLFHDKIAASGALSRNRSFIIEAASAGVGQYKRRNHPVLKSNFRREALSVRIVPYRLSRNSGTDNHNSLK